MFRSLESRRKECSDFHITVHFRLQNLSREWRCILLAHCPDSRVPCTVYIVHVLHVVIVLCDMVHVHVETLMVVGSNPAQDSFNVLSTNGLACVMSCIYM